MEWTSVVLIGLGVLFVLGLLALGAWMLAVRFMFKQVGEFNRDSADHIGRVFKKL